MSEQDDLDNLIKSPGWLRLKSWAEHEWKEQERLHSRRAADELSDVAAINKLRQVIAASQAVDLVLGWPESQIQKMHAKRAASAQPPQLSRRGSL